MRTRGIAQDIYFIHSSVYMSIPIFQFISFPASLHTFVWTNVEQIYPHIGSLSVDKEDVLHIYDGLLLSHKQEQNYVISRNMVGPRDHHTE